MCTKVPYANRWLATRALAKVRETGLQVRSIRPCFTDHPGAWHITRKKARTW